MKITWKGGPLDGCVKEVDTPTAVWIGPDVTEPLDKVVVYGLYTDAKGGLDYVYDQHLTDHANEFEGTLP